MTFDEMVELCNAKGDIFRSLHPTPTGYQVNILSRFASNSFACAQGLTPTEALENLLIQRRHLLPKKTAMDDLI
jgi:hypothetical protein